MTYDRELWRGGRAPWPHQLAAYEACAAQLQAGRSRGLVQMPTGTGKSRVIRALAYQLHRGRRRTLICLPTEEILGQMAADFRRECKIPFNIEKAERQAPSYSLITLASHQTIWRRLRYFARETVVLFDECHHANEHAGTNLQTVDGFAQVLGFSASPWSPECVATFGRTLYTYGLQQAIADGYLCEYELWPFPEIVPRPVGFELYYCEDNATARELARSCPGAAYLGYDSADRSQVVEGFRSGRVRRVYVNRMLTEGFDCPAVATIYVDKAPESDLLTYQMIGRGLRRKPDGGRLTIYARDLGAVRAALARAG